MGRGEPAGPRGGRISAVVALGTTRGGDDGAGSAALAELVSRYELPLEVETLDLGTPGPYLGEFLRGYSAILILDAVRIPGAPAGSLHVERDARRIRSAPRRTSPHDPNLGEALDLLALEGVSPDELLVLGVVPKRVQLGTELSPEVASSLAPLAAAVAEELDRLGAPARRRAMPLPANRWWERAGISAAPAWESSEKAPEA